MRDYVPSSATSAELADWLTERRYPLLAPTLEAFPALPNTAGGGRHYECAVPAPLPVVVETARRLARSPAQILEVGCGLGAQALYLASLGHRVVATDLSNEHFDRIKTAARERCIPPKNLELRTLDATDPWQVAGLGAEVDGFDGLVLTNVLCFLEPDAVPLTVSRLQQITRSGGLHAVSAYTTDNPRAEFARGLQQMFEGPEISQAYADWDLLHSSVGYGRLVVRSSQLALIPTTVDVLAQKPAT